MLDGSNERSVGPLRAEPSIEVVIPARDAERYLAETVRSALQQTVSPRRIHIIENCSRDGTLRIADRLAEEDGRVHLIRVDGCGEGAARNRGLAEAIGADLVALLDADDLWAPTFLSDAVTAFRAAPPRIGVVHSEYRLIDATGQPSPGRVRRAERSGDILRPLLLDGYAVTGSASGSVLRGEIVREGMRFDEDLEFAADWDFWLRVARGWEFAPIRRPLVAIRVRSDSVQHPFDHNAETAIARLGIELGIMLRHRDAVSQPELSDAMRRRIYIRAFSLRRRPRVLAQFLARAPAVLREADSLAGGLLRHLPRDLRRLVAAF